MYMFFWFFKQLYYCLRRIFKSGILLLIVFFIAFLFIFVKPSFAVNNNSPYYLTYKTNSNNIITVYSDVPFYVGPSASNNNYMTAYSFPGNRYITITVYRNGSLQNSNIGSSQYMGYPSSFSNISGNQSALYDKNNNLLFNSLNTPIITNDESSITNWSFTNLTIYCGDINPNSTFYLQCDYDGYTFSYDDLEQYKTITNNIAYINIPKSLLNQSIVLRNGFNFSFGLQANKPNMQVLYYDLGSYTLNLTTEQEEQINQDSDKQVLSDISNNQKETTQAIENLEDTITNSNIEDSSVYLPSDNTNDITQEGLNGIFTSIYNAFCIGEPQDIVFPIPFTNKNITLQPNYVRNMLTSSGANWVITIIEAFWWYLISRFIIKDITCKITKIKSGNIESIENTNIKGDML